MSYTIETSIIMRDRDLDLEVEILGASWENDGIGYYEFGSQKCFDRGTWYIEDFEIGDVSVNGRVIPPTKKCYQEIIEKLQESDSLRRKIEDEEKSRSEDARVDATLSARGW